MGIYLEHISYGREKIRLLVDFMQRIFREVLDTRRQKLLLVPGAYLVRPNWHVIKSPASQFICMMTATIHFSAAIYNFFQFLAGWPFSELVGIYQHLNIGIGIGMAQQLSTTRLTAGHNYNSGSPSTDHLLTSAVAFPA